MSLVAPPPPEVPLLEGLDLVSSAYRRDPAAAAQDALVHCPVGYYEPLHCFVVLRYDDVRAILADHETFSSRVYQSLSAPDVDPDVRRVGEMFVAGQALNMDPPQHTLNRKTVQRAFTRSRVEQSLSAIEAIANRVIDSFIERGECELLSEFSQRVALRSVSTMIGLAEADLPAFEAFIHTVPVLQTPISAPGNPNLSEDDVARAYANAYSAYRTFSEFVEDRRRSPRDDLASAMLALRDEDGAPVMTNDDALVHIIGITAAGTGTTANLMAYVVRRLTEQPKVLEEVRADPELWGPVIEETLRRESPSAVVWRLTTRDTEVEGIPIPANSMVAVNIASANADPARFPDPLAFDIHRPNLADHLAFGLARHFCMGAPLARPEARIALQALYERVPEIKADLEEELEFAPGFVVRALLHQHAHWRA